MQQPVPAAAAPTPTQEPDLAALLARLDQLEQRLVQAPAPASSGMLESQPVPPVTSGQTAQTAQPAQAIQSGRIRELEAALTARDEQIKTLLVSNVILNSPFLREKTVLPASIALEVFGRIFTVEAVDGTLTAVAHAPDGAALMSREDPSRLAAPEEALEIYIMQHYPERDAILRASHAGSGAAGNAARQSRTATSISRTDPKAFASNLEAIARGDVTVR